MTKQGELLEAPAVDVSTSRVDGGRPSLAGGEREGIVPARQSSGELEQILRMAADPNVPVDKLERLLAMHERMVDRDAAGAFESAMSDAQGEMRPVEADASNPQTKSKYASYAALDRALRPIYTKHGFSLSFGTGDAVADYVRVLCHVAHREGHSRDYKIDMPADGKGAKGGDVMTKTHAVGSGVAYGMRYLLKMIFNVAVGEDDDDGNRASRTASEGAPKGYAAWIDGMHDVADEGTARLEAEWKAAHPSFRAHVARHDSKRWQAIKAKAALSA